MKKRIIIIIVVILIAAVAAGIIVYRQPTKYEKICFDFSDIFMDYIEPPYTIEIKHYYVYLDENGTALYCRIDAIMKRSDIDKGAGYSILTAKNTGENIQVLNIANEIPTGLQQQLDALQEKDLRAGVINKYWQKNVK